MISAKEVEDAYDLLKAVVTKTPLQLDPYLSNKYQANIYLKEENLQKVRSFKLRGALYTLGKRHVSMDNNGVRVPSLSTLNDFRAYKWHAIKFK